MAARCAPTEAYKWLTVTPPWTPPKGAVLLRQYDRGLSAHRGYFHDRHARLRNAAGTRGGPGASPYYLFHPLARDRILARCPIKVIVILRNPVNGPSPMAAAVDLGWNRCRSPTRSPPNRTGWRAAGQRWWPYLQPELQALLRLARGHYADSLGGFDVVPARAS
jgi:hypothetical protein